MNARLFVCVTCDRCASTGEAGTRGARLAARIESMARGLPLTLRRVECLNGCPHPCNAALRDMGKCSIRFSRLDQSDCADLIAMAMRYAESAHGYPLENCIPEGLRRKISLSPVPLTGFALPTPYGSRPLH